jgi:O-methyltransferase domain
MRDLHRRFYLSDALYRLDYWRSQTRGRFHVRDLAIPEIGNPYGVCLEETLVSARAEFHHYCADRVANLLESKLSTVVEIGGGFGGMAYYLLRDQPTIKYCDFDVPESIALATYFLINAMPHKKFLLYGENSLTDEAIADADVVLMPLFAVKRLPTASADVTFSSHAMADIEAAELASYLSTIHRLTRNYFLFLGTTSLPRVPGLMGESCDPFQPIERRRLQWNRHRRAPSEEVECLYSFHYAYKAAQSPGRELAHVRR